MQSLSIFRSTEEGLRRVPEAFLACRRPAADVEPLVNLKDRGWRCAMSPFDDLHVDLLRESLSLGM